ncbi:MAG: chromate transporter [Coprobacillus sp.]|nr:chromate transporter [Coprobacillus sp.]
MIYWELFYTFFLIGLFTFGGGYAMIPLIEEQTLARGWATASELQDFIAISEITPGPFAVNISTFIGSQTAGIAGAACATIGVILPSFIIILIVAFILEKFIKNHWVEGALNGIKPIVIALILSTAFFFFVQLVFFGGNSVGSALSFDLKSLTLLLLLAGIYYGYYKTQKKRLNIIALLVLAAILGMLIYSVV